MQKLAAAKAKKNQEKKDDQIDIFKKNLIDKIRIKDQPDIYAYDPDEPKD